MNNEDQIKALQDEVDSLKATLAELEAMPVDEEYDDEESEEDIETDGNEELEEDDEEDDK